MGHMTWLQFGLPINGHSCSQRSNKNSWPGLQKKKQQNNQKPGISWTEMSLKDPSWMQPLQIHSYSWLEKSHKTSPKEFMVSNLFFKVMKLLEFTYIKNQWKLQNGDQESLPLLTQLSNTQQKNASAADRALWEASTGAHMTSKTSQASLLYSNKLLTQTQTNWGLIGYCRKMTKHVCRQV